MSAYPKHPTTNETINRLLDAMQPEIPYPFLKIWRSAFEWVLEERNMNLRASKRCLNQMIKEGLVTSNGSITGDDYADQTITITLTNLGNDIRESEGWISHLKKRGKWLNRIVKIAVIVEVVIIVVEVIIIYAQYRSNTAMEKRLEIVDGEYRGLEKEMQKQSEKIDSLDGLLRNQESKMQAMRDSISALKTKPVKGRK